ncbi:hypothetical protein Tco_0884043, partial [Tanacetum coccineum]
IVYDTEFSSRLSVALIIRLQTSAMMALSNDADPDSALMQRVARRFIFETRRSFNLWHDMHMYDSSDDGNDSSYRLSNNFDQSRNSVNSRASFVSLFMEAMPSQKEESSENFKEMFLAGTVIHIVPEKKNVDIPLYKRWATPDAQCGYEAYVANREVFKDMIVSPSMFIDHLPWSVRHALNREYWKCRGKLTRVGWCELETMMNYDLPFQSNGPTNSTDHQHIRIFFSSEILDANTEQDINLQNKISNYEHTLSTTRKLLMQSALVCRKVRGI